MSVGAKQVGEDEGIAGVTLAAGGRVARPTRLQRIRMNGDDLEVSLRQGVNEQPRWAFERDAERPAPGEATKLPEQGGEAFGRVGDGALPAPARGVIDDTDGVRPARPVDADEESHCVSSGDGETLRSERSCRSLTDWRSGLLGHLARHPVAGRGLSRFGSEERVSSWPSSGERGRLSPNTDRIIRLSTLGARTRSHFLARGRVVQ
jgi:hypothetical protein